MVHGHNEFDFCDTFQHLFVRREDRDHCHWAYVPDEPSLVLLIPVMQRE